MIFAGKTTFSVHLRTIPPLPAPRPSSSQEQWDYLCVLEFIGAYRDFYLLAMQRLTFFADQSLTSANPLNPHPRDLFLSGTPSYATMASGKTLILRTIAPILLINIMLFNQQDYSPDELTYQYWALRRKFHRCDVNLGSGPAYLTYALSMDPDMKSFTDFPSMFLLGRMLSVEVRISNSLRKKIEASLLGFISATSFEEAVDWCLPEEIQALVAAELLSA